jgi:ABC-type Na+ efflux pump permease subunit
MPRRLRSLVGSLGILVFVIVYALIAMALAESRILEAPKIVQSIFYMVLGIIWIFPVMPVIRWMDRP